MIKLKTLSPESIPSALLKAKRYRLLNEPNEAESICLDILAAAPNHQEALVLLLLALTDNFGNELNRSFQKALEAADLLHEQASRTYYTGIIYERRAKVHLRQGGPGSGSMAHDWFMQALESFDWTIKAQGLHHEDAVLRWNSCARILNMHPEVKPMESDNSEMLLDSFDTPH